MYSNITWLTKELQSVIIPTSPGHKANFVVVISTWCSQDTLHPPFTPAPPPHMSSPPPRVTPDDNLYANSARRPPLIVQAHNNHYILCTPRGQTCDLWGGNIQHHFTGMVIFYNIGVELKIGGELTFCGANTIN